MKRRKFIAVAGIAVVVPFVDTKELLLPKKYKCSRCKKYVDQLHWEHYYTISSYPKLHDSGYSYLSGSSYGISCKKCSDRWNKYSFGRKYIMDDNMKYKDVKLTERLLKEYEEAHYSKYGYEVLNWFNDVGEADWYKD